MTLVVLLVGCRPAEPGVGPTRATGSEDTGGPAATTTRVVQGGVVTCAEPERRREQVFDRIRIGADWPPEGAYPDPHRPLGVGGQGVVVADLDGDGLHDLLVPRDLGHSRLFRLGPDGPVELDGFVDPPIDDALGGSAADADGDGDTDVVLYRREGPTALLLNDGRGSFTATWPEAGLDRDGCGGSASWADLDLDGDLDLFLGKLDRRGREEGDTGLDLAVTPCPSTLLVNQLAETGALGWVDRSDLLSADVQLDRAMASGWLQIDADPWPELYVVTDFARELPGNRVLDNDGGGVLRQLDGHPLNVSLAGMGIGLADLNDDDLDDVFVPGIREYAVLQSAGAGVWVDHGAASGLRPDTRSGQHSGWGGEWVDLDNDGLLDLPVTFSPQANREGTQFAMQQPDEIHRQVAPGVFEPVGEAWGWADRGYSRGFVAADVDGNGFLDLVKREHAGGVTVDLGRCDERAWLRIRLHDDAGFNRDAVGATVAVEAGGVRFRRRVQQGSTSYVSGGPAEVHVGLGMRDEVDRIEVRWPDGEAVRLPGVATRQVVDVYR